jgi:hypothetical protein
MCSRHDPQVADDFAAAAVGASGTEQRDLPGKFVSAGVNATDDHGAGKLVLAGVLVLALAALAICSAVNLALVPCASSRLIQTRQGFHKDNCPHLVNGTTHFA